MKKILTFLMLMLFTASIVSAQNNATAVDDPTYVDEPAATIVPRFNYQAVVRDRNHDDNLVMSETVNVKIEIFETGNETAVYTENHSGETNRNGMISFVIGDVEDNTGLANVDWSKATIQATFTDAAGTTLSVVKNEVMPVPYALSANVDPLEITTKSICDYLSTAKYTAVDSVYNALVGNEMFSDTLKDRMIKYVKTQYDVVKDLALHFLYQVTTTDVQNAYDTISDDVKAKIKDIAIQYIKSDNGKAIVYDVVEYYLKNAEKSDVQDLWLAARDNDNFQEIFEAVRDSAITYIKNHKDLVKNIAMYYMTVIDSNDVKDLHSYMKQHNNPAYQYMINKLGDYLNYYLTNTYNAAQNCDNTTICDLKSELDELKYDAQGCPKFEATPTIIDGVFTVKLANVEGTTITASNLYVNNSAGETVVPITGTQWTSPSTAANTYTYDYNNLSDGSYTFVLEVTKTNCPAKREVVVTYPE